MTGRVRIVGDHPHSGKSGTIMDGGEIYVNGGAPMIHIKLDDAWADGCYAEERHLKPLPLEENRTHKE